MKIYQIYFQPEQLERYQFDYTPYFNEKPTVFLENEVIRTLIEQKKHEGTEYFGVLAYKFRPKLVEISLRTTPEITNISTKEFNKNDFGFMVHACEADVFGLGEYVPHDTVTVANRFHPKFIEFFSKVMAKIGYKWEPAINKHVFYCNYFVAKSEVYEKYVKEMLAPAMDVMKDMPELHDPSNYFRPFPENLKKEIGIEFWPYHPFLCERMFTYFAHIHKLRCVNY